MTLCLTCGALQMLKEAAVAIGKGVSAVFRFALSIPGRLAALATMSPSDWAKWWKGTWVWLKEEAHHFWVSLGENRHTYIQTSGEVCLPLALKSD